MRITAWALAPLVLVPLVFVAVLRLATPPAPLARSAVPDEAFDAARCNWSCHNRGCRHSPALPSMLTSDEALFGWAVRRLHAFGRVLIPDDDSGAGYGAANILIFCAAWPGLMFGLWVSGLSSREARRRLSAAPREAAAK